MKCEIRDDSIAIICAGIPWLERLETPLISLLTSEATRSIAKHLTSLNFLNMDDVPIGDDGVITLSGMQSIRTLSISNLE